MTALDEDLDALLTPAEAVAHARANTGGRSRRDKGATGPDAAAAKWQLVLTSEYADVTTGGVEQPIVSVSDWDGVLRHFGLDPAEFTVVDNTVRMSRWQQSKGLEDGTRSTVWLHAYSARFARITDRLPDADLEKVRKTVRKWRPLVRKTPGAGLGAPSTFYVGWADWQLGKGEGGGVEGTTQRVLDSFDQAQQRVKELRRVGRNIEAISVWNMGDPFEGCDSNYANQLFTVQLGRRQQLNLGIDLTLTGIRALAPLVDQFEYGTVLCNHGEWSRQGFGTKAVTDDSDNAGGFLAETIRTVLTGRPGFEHVRFTIPHDQMVMSSLMSGVPVAFTHGHKAPSGSAKEIEYLRGQSIKMLREQGVEPRLWMTAHRHHYEIKDYGPWTRVQHPSLDFGSKWYSDTSGHWSSPGTFTCLVGQHEQAGGLLSSQSARGFSDEMVLVAQ